MGAFLRDTVDNRENITKMSTLVSYLEISESSAKEASKRECVREVGGVN